ncbi:MAG: PspC domain-containing protein [Bacteroidales bacterium]|nr:PspC domain-containing protein [Bacteroidales bacterium]
MNKVEKASIGGYAFTFETEAYSAVKEYLEELGNFYIKRESGNEIMEDIEERVAELLLEKCGEGNVVTTHNIEEVIATLGRPEELERDFAESEADGGSNGAEGGNGIAGGDGKDGGRQRGEKKRGEGGKRLMRDMDKRVVGGVCSGLAATYNIDVALLRLGFAILTILGMISFWDWDNHSITISLLGPILYLILWIAMPAAKTVEQKWELRGKGRTVDEISRTVSEGVKSAASDVREFSSTVPARKIWRAFSICIGLALIIIGIAGLAAGAGILIGKYTGIMSGVWSQIYEEAALDAPWLLGMLRHPLYAVLLCLVYFLPFIGMLYGGLQLVMDFKSPKWHPGLIVFILWLITLVILGITTISMLAIAQ